MTSARRTARGAGAGSGDGGSGDGGADVGRLDAADLPGVARLWNDALGDAHPLGMDGLRRWWDSPEFDPGLVFGARSGGELTGALLARAPAVAWAPPDVGHVGLLVVSRDVVGRGVGAALWRAAAAELLRRGRTRVRLGTEPDHLLPGVPAVAPPATWRFLAARGAAFGALEGDLTLDLRRRGARDALGAPGASGATSVRVEPAAELVVPAVARWFPGRWADEVARAADEGVTLLAGFAGDALVGFAVASQPTDVRTGPGLVWARALEGRPGGLGPLGIDPARRGQGLGLGLVAAAARWHADHGTEDLVFDWTSLWTFYGRLGARVWRVYQRAEAPIPEGTDAG